MPKAYPKEVKSRQCSRAAKSPQRAEFRAPGQIPIAAGEAGSFPPTSMSGGSSSKATDDPPF